MWIVSLLSLLTAPALAYVDPKCEEVAAKGTPEGYSEQGQQDFLLNYFALATTLSPLHAPIPYGDGRGSIGLELAGIPPLSCERRLVLDYTKTEDTNKAPVAPRPRMIFSFPSIGKVHLYGGAAYIPPVTVFGTRNVIASGELGAGVKVGEGWQLGGRYHYTLMKTVAEIATPFVEGDPAYDDFFSGSTLGVDLMAGKMIKEGIIPYAAVGFTDASTFFWIGDDAIVSNNLSPYQSVTASVGVQARIGAFDTAAEFYTAPGYLYTGRVRVAYLFKGG